MELMNLYEPHESANMIGEIIVNPLVQEVVEEEEKEKSVPGFSIILLLSTLAAAGILDRRKMDGNCDSMKMPKLSDGEIYNSIIHVRYIASTRRSNDDENF